MTAEPRKPKLPRLTVEGNQRDLDAMLRWARTHAPSIATLPRSSK